MNFMGSLDWVPAWYTVNSALYDARDWDQNLIGSILGLDRLIPAIDHLIFTKIYIVADFLTNL